MRYHSQNLNESRDGNIIGSMFWHGRAWLYTRREIHWEWCLGKHSRSFRLGLDFGYGDGDDGIMLAFCLPFLFSIYLGIDGVFRCKKPCEVGISIYDNTFYLKTFSYSNEWSATDSWWRKGLHFNFPWQMDHYRTEILSHAGEVVYVERRGEGKIEHWKRRDLAEQSVQKTYPYCYVLKSGKVQVREATVHVDRMEWRARWWPLIWRRKVRTSINVKFSDEVGEKTGSWKGGCTGCGYDMLPGETPEQCLRRMEHNRKF